MLLGQGTYNIGVAITEVMSDNTRGQIYLFDTNILTIAIKGIATGSSPVQFLGDWSIIKM
jgi:hypothetical protein